MTGATGPSRVRKFSRQTYFVDLKLQLTVAFTLVAVLLLVGALYAAAIFLLPGGGALERLSAAETRALFLRTNLIYLVLAGAILWTVAVLLMHRVAGPARKLEKAVAGLRREDYTHPLSLRKRDYLKSLAAELEKLAAEMKQQADQRRQILQDLDRCLREGDIEAAREIAARLRAPATAESTRQGAPSAV